MMKRLLAVLLFTIASTLTHGQKHAYSVFAIGQYGGSSGKQSLGIGLESNSQRFALDARVGRTPHSDVPTIISPSLRFLWIPFHIKVGERYQFKPVAIGAMISGHFYPGSELTWAGDYESGYYWWSRNLRIHPVYQVAVQRQFHNSILFSKMSMFFEANSNDLYIASYYSNSTELLLTDIIKMGVGVRFHFH